jgi:enamine deaminase RidA (YjgF/YER057c/UK114 family)
MPLDDIEFLSPPGAIKPTGPWSLGVRAGDFVFVAGMRGIDPATNKLVDGEEACIRRAFLNMKTIVDAAGGSLRGTVRLVVYVTDMDRHRPLVNKIQEEFWSGPPYPPTRRAPLSRSAASIRTTSSRWKGRSFVRCVARVSPTVTFRICRADPSPAPP